MDSLNITSIIFVILCVLFVIAFVAAIKKRKVLGAVRNFTFAFLMLVIALLLATISLSTQGYKALTQEVLAANVVIEPIDDQKFIAHFRFPDNSRAKYEISGDELYVDAHILKWKSLANVFGLHTLYELDRVAGRYSSLEDEKERQRTVYSLAGEKTVDIFDLRTRYEVLSFLLDAEYGSATFIDVKKASRFKIMVSTTGLLFRTDENRVQ